MSDTQPTIEVTHQEGERDWSAPAASNHIRKPAPVRAAADPATPAPEIITTIALKPGVKITIEYPA